MTDVADPETVDETPGRPRPLLHTALTALTQRVRVLSDLRRLDDPQPDDPFLGLYISDERLGALLERRPPWLHETTPPASADFGDPTNETIASLATSFALDGDDLAVLIAAAAPDLDPRFERFYGYLNDDVTLKRATVGLALELCGLDPFDPRERARCLSPVTSSLLRHRLITVEEPDRPMMSRSLRVPDRVVHFLLGDHMVDDQLDGLTTSPASIDAPTDTRLAAAMSDEQTLIYLRDESPDLCREVARSVADQIGLDVLCIDLEAVPANQLTDLAPIAGRESEMGRAVLVAGPLDPTVPGASESIGRWAEAARRVVLHGNSAWNPAWSARTPSQHVLESFGPSTRSSWWLDQLGDAQLTDDQVAALGSLRLSATSIERAASTARTRARHRGSQLALSDIHAGVRQQNAARLQTLATCVEPKVGWDQLVVPTDVETALRRLASRVRHRDRVVTDWGMRPGGNRGSGVTALFAGEPGTGKTMSAEVIASDLGIDLYVINLATLVDKYIGETEKNLDRVFTDAAGVNGVLLFDEADAIFGQRSEVKDSHDRYANLEVAFLLQRIEQFDGLAILSTNLRSNLDDAFARRLDSIIDFQLPSAGHRLSIWRRALAPLPLDGVDLDFCSESFKLSGGNIRSIAVTAGYRVAESGDPITMATLIGCIGEEYRKLGRLCLREEFGPYIDVLTTTLTPEV